MEEDTEEREDKKTESLGYYPTDSGKAAMMKQEKTSRGSERIGGLLPSGDSGRKFARLLSSPVDRIASSRFSLLTIVPPRLHPPPHHHHHPDVVLTLPPALINFHAPPPPPPPHNALQSNGIKVI
ncbi:hypothetical protein EYF80_013397 [Liparis tanakae]|uniref:Uncharacterized protein n=1 Tax=Liparis tanakae TaxID=230148 RepID=A0A4Z2IE78_9TELE|nr:hypothetical protein EYF80_013397 [Liparis tanakae]